MELMSDEKDMEECLQQIRGRGLEEGGERMDELEDVINNANWRKA